MPHDSTRLRADGEAIQLLRILAGLTVTQLSVKASVSRPYLSNIEQGRRPYPGPDVVARIAKALGVTLGDIATPETRAA